MSKLITVVLIVAVVASRVSWLVEKWNGRR